MKENRKENKEKGNYLESISGILLLIGLLAIFMMGILYLKRSEVK